MRIGIEITPLTHTPTGVGYYVRHLLAAMVRQSDAHSLRGFASGVRPLDADHIPIWYVRLPVPTRLLYHSWELLGYPRVDRMLGGVDVYHAVNYVLPPVKQARRVLSIHDLSFLRHPQWSSPKIVAPFQRSIRRHAHEADAVITCSQATRQDIIDLLETPPERVHVIHDAADDSFRPMDRERAARIVSESLGISSPYMLFVGTLEPRKNVLGLLEAFARAEASHRLVVVGGKGWGMDDLAGHVARLGLEERVVFLGYVQDRDLFPALYNGADAFLFPSWYEGFGLPILEAMACGCPVIASNTSSLPEVGGDAPCYVDPEDVEALTNAIEQLAADAGMRQRMREKGLLRARCFSWRLCAEQTLACYRSLV